MSIAEDAEKIRRDIEKVVTGIIHKITRPCLRLYKGKVVVAPSLQNGKIVCGVQLTGDDTPISVATHYAVAVNDVVWVATVYNSFANAYVYSLGDMKTPAPVVTKSGTITQSGNEWSYRRWSDGTVECWATLTYADVSASVGIGSLFESDTTFSAAYPFTFTTPPYQILTIGPSDKEYSVFGSGRNSTENTGEWYFLAPLVDDGYYSASVNIYVKGQITT